MNEYDPKNKTVVKPQDTLIVTPQQQTAATKQDAQTTLSKEDPTKKGTLMFGINYMKQVISIIAMSIYIYALRFILGKWNFSKQADLLMVFKNMLLGGLKKDDYKELAKILNEIGWNRPYDQCRHEVPVFLFLFFICCEVKS